MSLSSKILQRKCITTQENRVALTGESAMSPSITVTQPSKQRQLPSSVLETRGFTCQQMPIKHSQAQYLPSSQTQHALQTLAASYLLIAMTTSMNSKTSHSSSLQTSGSIFLRKSISAPKMDNALFQSPQTPIHSCLSELYS